MCVGQRMLVVGDFNAGPSIILWLTKSTSAGRIVE